MVQYILERQGRVHNIGKTVQSTDHNINTHACSHSVSSMCESVFLHGFIYSPCAGQLITVLVSFHPVNSTTSPLCAECTILDGCHSNLATAVNRHTCKDV